MPTTTVIGDSADDDYRAAPGREPVGGQWLGICLPGLALDLALLPPPGFQGSASGSLVTRIGVDVRRC
jgi:hypothetical protein